MSEFLCVAARIGLGIAAFAAVAAVIWLPARWLGRSVMEEHEPLWEFIEGITILTMAICVLVLVGMAGRAAYELGAFFLGACGDR